MTPKENEVNWVDTILEEIMQKNSLEAENIIWKTDIET